MNVTYECPHCGKFFRARKDYTIVTPECPGCFAKVTAENRVYRKRLRCLCPDPMCGLVFMAAFPLDGSCCKCPQCESVVNDDDAFPVLPVRLAACLARRVRGTGVWVGKYLTFLGFGSGYAVGAFGLGLVKTACAMGCGLKTMVSRFGLGLTGTVSFLADSMTSAPARLINMLERRRRLRREVKEHLADRMMDIADNRDEVLFKKGDMVVEAKNNVEVRILEMIDRHETKEKETADRLASLCETLAKPAIVRPQNLGPPPIMPCPLDSLLPGYLYKIIVEGSEVICDIVRHRTVFDVVSLTNRGISFFSGHGNPSSYCRPGYLVDYDHCFLVKRCWAEIKPGDCDTETIGRLLEADVGIYHNYNTIFSGPLSMLTLRDSACYGTIMHKFLEVRTGICECNNASIRFVFDGVELKPKKRF